jgi:tRNA pseudouridine13 synthase
VPTPLDWLVPLQPDHPALAWDPRVLPRRYLTHDIPGIGGRLKARPEDFLVEEIPAYHPSGQGEHLFLMVQKTGLSTFQMLGVIARHFRVKTHHLGYAGLKDKQAITRQVVSVHIPGRTAADFPSLQHPKIAILWAEMHENKLRRGHLKGNRFSIRVRDVDPAKVLTAKRVFDRLTRTGVPNRLGEQRFGRCANNHIIGRAMIQGDAATALRELLLPAGDDRPEHARQRELILAGDFEGALRTLPEGAPTERDALWALARGATPEQALLSINAQSRAFFASSFQSAVFNELLEQRLAADTLDTLGPGDIAFKHDNGACFAVDDAALADPDTADRLKGLAISPSGPMWGTRMTRAAGEVAQREAAALAGVGVDEAMIERFVQRAGQPIPGERRAYRIPIKFPEYEGGSDEFGPFVRCAFELPPGAFATVALRELMKPEALAGSTPASSALAMGDAFD